jgi:hypothetical protein
VIVLDASVAIKLDLAAQRSAKALALFQTTAQIGE